MRYLAAERAGNAGRYVFAEADRPTPGPDQVLLRMRAASLNFRDLILLDHAKPGDPDRAPWPPFSDGCGVIEAVGDGVRGLAEGDRVVTLFFQGWDGGPPTRARLGASLGGPVPGIGAEYVVLDASGVAAAPAHLNDVQAACLPCAALTAWHGLIEANPIAPGGTVLLIGTGGVSIFALQFARAAGYRTIILSSSDDKLERCRALGADVTINYRAVSDWHREVRRATGGAGVDLVIEVGGAATIERSLKSTRIGGAITLIGGVSGYQLPIDSMAMITNAIAIRGVNVGSRDMFVRMADFIAQRRIEPVVDRVFDWAETNAALAHLREGRHFGKVALTID